MQTTFLQVEFDVKDGEIRGFAVFDTWNFWNPRTWFPVGSDLKEVADVYFVRE